MKKNKPTFVIFFSLLILALSIWPAIHAGAGESGRWSTLKEKYARDRSVDRLIFVKYKGNSRARFLMYIKRGDGSWKKVISCKAYLGKKGIGKKREGDKKTPTGTFGFSQAFGIKKNPGTSLPYVKVTPYLYWSARRKDYNRLVDSRKAKGVYGEQLIRYRPQYNYAINIDYNPKNIYMKGSAIFLHCSGSHAYTLGCVAIPEKYMKKVLKNATDHMKICIYRR